MTTTLGNLTRKDEFELECAFNMTALGNLIRKEEFGSGFNMTTLGNQIWKDVLGSDFNMTKTFGDEFEDDINMTTLGNLTMDKELKSAVKGPEPNMNPIPNSLKRIDLPPKLAARMDLGHRIAMSKKVVVRGFDRSLRKTDIRSALTDHFSSCGEIVKVEFAPRDAPISDPNTRAMVCMEGEDAEDKALQLNDSDMGGCKLTVTPLYPRSTQLPPEIYLSPGFNVPFCFVPPKIKNKIKKKKNKKKKNKYHT